MAAFMRPSDLARIPFASCQVDPRSGCLKLKVVAPKEKRQKRRIIKPSSIHPHVTDIELCPVHCFKVLRDHPDLRLRPSDSSLFVKSNNIKKPLVAATISSWLHREFISKSTTESRVSIRSIASSSARESGVSMEHLVSLGNWASADTFVNHYQRNHMANIDFTSTVLTAPSTDEFFDAPDSFESSSN